MEYYDLFYHGAKINKAPLTESKADNEIGLIVMNYGYKPEKRICLNFKAKRAAINQGFTRS